MSWVVRLSHAVPAIMPTEKPQSVLMSLLSNDLTIRDGRRPTADYDNDAAAAINWRVYNEVTRLVLALAHILHSKLVAPTGLFLGCVELVYGGEISFNYINLKRIEGIERDK